MQGLLLYVRPLLCYSELCARPLLCHVHLSVPSSSSILWASQLLSQWLSWNCTPWCLSSRPALGEGIPWE